MNVIFLDIDGVLNNETHTVLLHEMLGQEQYLEILKEMQEIPFDYQSCILVQKLIQETNSKVILSSTWRVHPRGIEAINKYAGIVIADITPRLSSAIRGEEIKQFLDNNKEITNYVIIDDDSDMLEEQKEHFVKINNRFGFRQKDYDRCLKILQNKKIDFFTSGDEEYDLHYHEEDWADEFEREREEENIMRRLEEEDEGF